MYELSAIWRAASRVLRRTQDGLVPLTAAASAALLAITSGAASAQGPAGSDRYVYGPPMMGGWGGNVFGMVFGPLTMILVLVAVILLVRWLVGPWQGGGSAPAPPPPTPLDILKARFARGEIDKEEFAERRRVLSE